ncbi:MAG: hypothetical protein POELPBGB_02947 [Bacteroidia bacterium]|nr:hypothetical protein [Bacteroidia bacterium]
MIQFEIDSSKEGVEIYIDSDGINELINYLNFIKNEEDHMHLVAGNELSEGLNQKGNKCIKHVRLVYIDKNE